MPCKNKRKVRIPRCFKLQPSTGSESRVENYPTSRIINVESIEGKVLQAFQFHGGKIGVKTIFCIEKHIIEKTDFAERIKVECNMD